MLSQVVQLQKVQNVSLHSSYNLKKAQMTSALQGSKCTPPANRLPWLWLASWFVANA
jgi:hypothetical protein